ncbi:FecR family protein [Flavobacterium sp. LS1R49]|uniref:FecR family protein n=1 Tax=Flavobacterium shii TaxID=2987687 RepID=A0A9X2ZCH9_9FLAO|nr:FecR family protein [Flavobacterium shii]MCV9928569.1 FecR family protein [Flavobacterium shii]
MIKKTKHSLEYLIDKSSKKETTTAEENLLHNFAQSEYDNSEWETSVMGIKEQVSEKIYDNIKNHINQDKTFSIYLKYAIAASIALLIGLGVYFKPSLENEKLLTLETTTVSDSIKLKDGSIVYLAANSILEYPVQFNGSQRKVSLLKGNAFFNVAKDHKHPFIISSGEITTRVVGTSFHIQLSQDKCSVIVVTGKVNVTSKNQSVDLKPSEEALFVANNLTKHQANSSLLINWYKEDVTLDNVTLNEVITLLQYKYGVVFNLKKGVSINTKLTVYVEKEASLEDVLKQINYITNLKLEQHDRTVTVN